jgi:hypothetical protein
LHRQTKRNCHAFTNALPLHAIRFDPLIMTELKVIFSQTIDSTKIDHPNFVEREAITDEEKSENFLRLWASHELYKWYSEWVPVFNLRTFHLRKIIKIDVYWNNKLERSYVQKRLTKDLIFDEKKEYKIRLKDGIYVLKPFIANYKNLTKKQYLEKPIQPSNFSVLLNSIEYQQKPKIKFATPILYTGMTN